MSQRIFGVVLLLACAGLGVVAWGYHAPFSYEPVGPRAYPMLLLTLMGLGAIYLLVKKPSGSTGHSDEPQASTNHAGPVCGIRTATCRGSGSGSGSGSQRASKPASILRCAHTI